MKSKSPLNPSGRRGRLRNLRVPWREVVVPMWEERRIFRGCVLGALLQTLCATAYGADTTNTLTQGQMFEGGTNTYNNWVDFSFGGLLTHGDQAQAQQFLQMNRGAFGGIEDLHVQGAMNTNVNVTLDGHSIFDNRDYGISLKFEHPELWYLRFSVDNFRTWYANDGGFYPPTGQLYTRPDSPMAVERGNYSIEGGLNLKENGSFTVKYSHTYRDGGDATTIWGPTHPDPSNGALIRGAYPNTLSLDESSDAVELDYKRKIKETDVTLGGRFETGTINDSGLLTFYPGEPIQQKVTDKEGETYDLVSVHAFTETWISKKVFFSSGYMFENLDSTFHGSRIYGDDFDVDYVPNAMNGLGYYSLNGGAHQQNYVMNMNLLAMPTKTWSLVPAIRVQQENWSADSGGVGTLGTASEPFAAEADRRALDVRESLTARYTGFTNWVLHASGDWTEGDGNLNEKGGLSQVNGIGVPPVLEHTDDSRLFQKYSAGVTWYPLRQLTLDAGGYYKHNHYDYTINEDSTPNGPASANRYPAYLVFQGFTTYDGNVRATVRPLQNVTVIGRYEYQRSTVDTEPDPASGLSEIESSKMTTHIIGGNVSWIPWNRLSLQAGLDDVMSDTKTPTSSGSALDAANGAGYTAAILNSRNNYWTINFSSGLVLDDKTDLNVSYFFYDADNFQHDTSVTLPLGAASREHGVTATLTRRITPNIRVSMRYGYYNYHDLTSDGQGDFEAHVVYTTLQYRF